MMSRRPPRARSAREQLRAGLSGRLAERARPHALDLHAIAADLAERGLRPVTDHDLRLIRADCPTCFASDTDPLRLWRPLQVVPRRGHTTYLCGACGAEARHV